MILITPDYILLQEHIISVYTNIEEFIETIDETSAEGLLDIDSKEVAELYNYLSLQASNPGSVFIGIFYAVHPLKYELQVCWTLLKNTKEYKVFLSALADNSVFDLSNNHAFDNDIEDITVFESPYPTEHLAEEEDEYDLELELDDSFLDNNDG